MTHRTPALSAETLEPRETPAVIGGSDVSFGGTGTITVSGMVFNAVAVQADGKVVAAGTKGGDLVVARYNPDGTPDTTFDGDGIKAVDAGGANDVARAVAVQADGKIAVAGTNGSDAVVARLRADGTLDTSLNGTGLKAIDFGGSADGANGLAIQSNGRIVVAGTNGSDFAVARLNPADGSLDTTAFNGTGQALLDLGGTADVANAAVVQADGKMVIGGTNGADFALARFNPDGTLDTNFDADGRRVIDAGGGSDTITGLALQADGKLVIGGSDGADLVAARLIPANGELDNTFNGGGIKTVDGNGTDQGRGVAIQGDGKVVLAGKDGTGKVVAARLRPDGTLDTSFGNAGVATVDVGGSGAGNGVAVAPGGRIVIAGQSGAGASVVRLDGSLGLGTQLAVGGSLDGTAQVYTPAADGSGLNPAATTLTAFSQFYGNVRTATGDVNGDGYADTVLVTGPGTPIGFAVVSGADNRTLLVNPTSPFIGSETFSGGGFVAVGDLDNDGRAEVVITPDQGGGPRVAVFSLTAVRGLVQRQNFFGIDDPDFRGGARAAVGDVNGDGVREVIVAAGFQGGPRVAVFEGKSLFAGQPSKLTNDFFAFPGDDAETLRNGAFVTAGDLDGDGYADLIFGGGPGGGPRVFALSGKLLSAGDVAATYAAPVANFFVNGDTASRGGVRLTAMDVDGDARADLVAGSGEGLTDQVVVYLGVRVTPDGEPPVAQRLDPFQTRVALRNGLFVG